jgi:hypothetical protein
MMCGDAQVEVGRPVYLPTLRGRGERDTVEMEGGFSLHGQTNAKYNGGPWTVQSQKVTTSDECGECGPGVKCLHVTGAKVATYKVDVSISMPSMPGGLNKCEQKAVTDFLKNVLLPHEQDHRKRFKTYEGTTKVPIDVTGCGKAGVAAEIDAIHNPEAQQREAAANALSGAIDPFTVQVDTSACDES